MEQINEIVAALHQVPEDTGHTCFIWYCIVFCGLVVIFFVLFSTFKSKQVVAKKVPKAKIKR